MIKKSILFLFVLILVFLGICLMVGVYGQDINPNENELYPFFGLAFPYFLWANVFMLLVLFMRKKVILFIPLVALVYAWPSFKNYYKIFAKSEFSKAEIEEINLISYNVRIFDVNENLGGHMKDSIFSALSKIENNIICFQEFYFAEKSGVFETASLVKTDLGLKNSHEHYTHHMRGGYHSGAATFTSFPILNKGEINFDSDANNTCIYSDLKVGLDTIRVYNAHLSSIRFQNEDYELIHENRENIQWNESTLKRSRRVLSLLNKAYKKRASQLQKVLDHIYECPYPVVLAGDFNDTPVSYCYNQTRKYLTDSFVESGSGVGNTYIGDFPSFRIDYIFHSEEIESAAFETFQFEYSDHKPIFSKLRVKPINN